MFWRFGKAGWRKAGKELSGKVGKTLGSCFIWENLAAPGLYLQGGFASHPPAHPDQSGVLLFLHLIFTLFTKPWRHFWCHFSLHGGRGKIPRSALRGKVFMEWHWECILSINSSHLLSYFISFFPCSSEKDCSVLKKNKILNWKQRERWWLCFYFFSPPADFHATLWNPCQVKGEVSAFPFMP